MLDAFWLVLFFFFGFDAGDADELEAVGGGGEDVETEVGEEHLVALGGNGAGGVEDVAGEGLVVVVLGDVEVELLVDGGNLAAARKFVDAGGCFGAGEA